MTIWVFLKAVLVITGVKAATTGSVNTTRMEQFDDLFTNPNRIAVGNCEKKGKAADLGSCQRFASSSANAHCQTARDCCNRCQCNHGFPTYLMHLARCVTDAQLSKFLHNQGIPECHFRLSRSDLTGPTQAQEELCSLRHWFPTVDLRASQNIYSCQQLPPEVKSTRCSVSGGKYLHFGQWRHIPNAASIFPVQNKGSLFIFKPTSHARQYRGHLISLSVTCSVNRGTPMSSCVTFKAAGIKTGYPQLKTKHPPAPVPQTTSASPSVSLPTRNSTSLFSLRERSTIPVALNEEEIMANTEPRSTALLEFGSQKMTYKAIPLVVPLLCGGFFLAAVLTLGISLLRRIKQRGDMFTKSTNTVRPSPRSVIEEQAENSIHVCERADGVTIPASGLEHLPIAEQSAIHSGLYQPLRYDKGELNGQGSFYATFRAGKTIPGEFAGNECNEKSQIEETGAQNAAVYQDLSDRSVSAITPKQDFDESRIYQSLTRSEQEKSRDPDPYYLEIQAPGAGSAVEEAGNTDEEPYYHTLEPDLP